MPLWGFLLSFLIAVMWAASPTMVARMALSKYLKRNKSHQVDIILFSPHIFAPYVTEAYR